jgi:hypothetical protein
LPTQGAGWTCDVITSVGNQLDDDGEPMPAEKIELWRRDPVECVRELLGNPALKEDMKYAPERVYEDVEGNSRVFDEMWTGDWWWETQVIFLALNDFDAYLVLEKITSQFNNCSIDNFI